VRTLAAIIFDFDGVIANSEPLHFQAFRDELAQRGVELTESEYYAEFLGFDDAGAFRAVGAKHGAAWTAHEIGAMVAHKAERMEALDRDTSVLFPGAADAVRRAAAAVPIAIASGALTSEIERTLDREGLLRYFVAIVGADQTAASKPAPDPYLEALARLQRHAPSLRAEECIAIEDSHWGLESARAAGLRTVAVTHTYPAADLALADTIITNIADLDIDQLNQAVFRV
jgi:HAD superfamily hydrolase (TIGR01509 family)